MRRGADPTGDTMNFLDTLILGADIGRSLGGWRGTIPGMTLMGGMITTIWARRVCVQPGISWEPIVVATGSRRGRACLEASPPGEERGPARPHSGHEDTSKRINLRRKKNYYYRSRGVSVTTLLHKYRQGSLGGGNYGVSSACD